MNKSLVPLIMSFAVIILLTFIVIYSRREAPLALDRSSDASYFSTISLGKKDKFISHKPIQAVPQQNEGDPKSKYQPDTAKLMENARTFLSRGLEKDAENELKTLLIFEPDNKNALVLLGGTLFYAKRYPEAELIFGRLHQIDPKSSTYCNQLASAVAKQGRLDEAIAYASKAVEIEQDSADALINLSGMLAAKGEIREANRRFLQVYKLIGYRILPFSLDPAFDSLRNTPEFQEIVRMARGDWERQILPSTAIEESNSEADISFPEIDNEP